MAETEKFEVISSKVFRVRNFSRLLSNLHPDDRSQAILCFFYEARARLRNPIYGCVPKICYLENQVRNLQFQVASLTEQLSVFQSPLLPEPLPHLPEVSLPFPEPQSSPPLSEQFSIFQSLNVPEPSPPLSEQFSAFQSHHFPAQLPPLPEVSLPLPETLPPLPELTLPLPGLTYSSIFNSGNYIPIPQFSGQASSSTLPGQSYPSVFNSSDWASISQFTGQPSSSTLPGPSYPSVFNSSDCAPIPLDPPQADAQFPINDDHASRDFADSLLLDLDLDFDENL